MPIGRSQCCTMIITRKTEWEEFESHRTGRSCRDRACLHTGFFFYGKSSEGIMQYILHIGCVLTVFHPYALLQRERLAQTVQKANNITVKTESFEIDIAPRMNSSPFILIHPQLNDRSIW